METALANGYKVCTVPQEMLSLAWPSVLPYIEQAFGDDPMQTPRDVYNQLEDGLADLWIVEKDKVLKAACITQVVPYPRGHALRIWVLAGEDIKKWKQAMDVLHAFARAHNCKRIEAFGRPGWLKLAKEIGFKDVRAMMTVPVDPATH
jgi:hypothetical protein